jgi:hypothetical protein
MTDSTFGGAVTRKNIPADVDGEWTSLRPKRTNEHMLSRYTQMLSGASERLSCFILRGPVVGIKRWTLLPGYG